MRPMIPIMTLATATLIVACDKSSPDSTITPPKDTASPATTTSAPIAAATLSAPTTPTTVASAIAVTTAVSSSAATSAVAGKGKDAGAGATAALKPASKHVDGNNFALDIASPGCKSGEECAVTIKLAATGAYHVNKEYPYKFIATPATGVAFLGKSDPNTFTRAAGDFVEQGEKGGLMTVRFKPSAPGEAKVAGKYKLSVCSADQCLIEEPMIDLAVPVI